MNQYLFLFFEGLRRRLPGQQTNLKGGFKGAQHFLCRSVCTRVVTQNHRPRLHVLFLERVELA